MLKPCICHGLWGLRTRGGERGTLYTLVSLMMSAGDCPAKYIARTENLHGGILYWPARHVLVETKVYCCKCSFAGTHRHTNAVLASAHVNSDYIPSPDKLSFHLQA